MSKGSRRICLALDFDGTLFDRSNPHLKPGEKFHPLDLESLSRARREKNALVVIATGRNLLSLCRSLSIQSKHHSLSKQPWIASSSNSNNNNNNNKETSFASLPFDYLILGGGCCCLNSKTQEILFKQVLSSSLAFRIARAFIDSNIPFFLLKGPPKMDEVLFWHKYDTNNNSPSSSSSSSTVMPEDFAQRLSTYSLSVAENNSANENDISSPCRFFPENVTQSEFEKQYESIGFSQFLLTFACREKSAKEIEEAERIVKSCCSTTSSSSSSSSSSSGSEVRFSRTTSPVNQKACWLEIFDAKIGKDKALNKLLSSSSSSSSLFDSREKLEEKGDEDQKGEEKEREGSFPTFKKIAAGNDHNDEDLLLDSDVACLVSNTPKPLIEKYQNSFHILKETGGNGAMAELCEKFVF